MLGGGRHALDGLSRAGLGMGLDATRTEHGTILGDHAEGELGAAEIESQDFTHGKGSVAGRALEVVLQADDIGKVRGGNFQQDTVLQGLESVDGANRDMDRLTRSQSVGVSAPTVAGFSPGVSGRKVRFTRPESRNSVSVLRSWY